MVSIEGKNAAYYIRQSHFDSDRMAGSVPAWKNNQNQDNATVSGPLSLNEEQQNKNVTAPSLSFNELLDIINPLHHLPVVGNVYRDLTNDSISGVARIAGGSIYGGPLGGAVSLINAAVEEHSGESIENAISLGVDDYAYKDAFAEESRTAGSKLNKAVYDNQDKDLKAIAKMPENLFSAMTTFEPVTEVMIKQADASEVLKREQKTWSFNS